MRKLFLRGCFSVMFLFATGSTLPAQNAPEGKRFERDETSVTVPYFLAGIALVIVMTLVCMPARRE